MSTSERQHRWEGFERKHERQDWDGMDTYGGKMMSILLYRKMLRMELPGKRKRGRPQRRFKWMWWKRTWLRLKWRRRIQKLKQPEKENPLWRPVMGKAESRRRRIEEFTFLCVPLLIDRWNATYKCTSSISLSASCVILMMCYKKNVQWCWINKHNT